MKLQVTRGNEHEKSIFKGMVEGGRNQSNQDSGTDSNSDHRNGGSNESGELDRRTLSIVLSRDFISSDFTCWTAGSN